MKEMLIRNDEGGVGGHGPFAYPEGAPIVGAEEVKRIQDKFNKKDEIISLEAKNKKRF